MGIEKLAQEDFELLKEAVWRNKPSLMNVANLVGKSALTAEQRSALREALADELCSTGLMSDGEPNERGVKLDAIIGKLMFY
jgi:hypothetical protein